MGQLDNSLNAPVEISDRVIETERKTGQVYFIRHGESTSNERNIFAGVLDVGLTAFGKLQARR
ncbi:MAG: phosphoglycerate mutase family protein, partial [Phormidium sp.]